MMSRIGVPAAGAPGQGLISWPAGARLLWAHIASILGLGAREEVSLPPLLRTPS